MSRPFLCATLILALPAVMALAQPKPADSLKPLTVLVIDAETGKPIPAFEYSYRAEGPGGFEAGDWDWTAVRAEDGAVKLELPASCVLNFEARAPGYVYYGTTWAERYLIRTGDRERGIRHKLQHGITVAGRVIDAATSQPVAGVQVSPILPEGHSIRFDHDRSVFTAQDGRFQIAGIGDTIVFEHADYLTTGWNARDSETSADRPAADVAVKLEAGETIFGVVRNRDGKPIPDAMVDAGEGKTTRTAADGSFRIGGGRRHWDSWRFFYVCVKHPGFMEYWKALRDIPAGGLKITLQPLFEIHGCVVDPGGQPVKQYTVIAGAGDRPFLWNCALAKVADDDGRFSIAIDTQAISLGDPAEDREPVEPRHWLAIWTGDHAVWETFVSFDSAGVDVKATLQPGVAVSGRLKGMPASVKGGAAALVPARPPFEFTNEESAPQKVGTIKADIEPDGTFEFVNVRPDKYALRISGKGITPRKITVEVPNKDLELPPIEVQATGRVVGRIFTREGRPWEFALGVVYHSGSDPCPERFFRAGEDGRFAIEDVPAGEMQVGAEDEPGPCEINVYVEHVNVVPGGEVKVEVNKPDPSHDVKP